MPNPNPARNSMRYRILYLRQPEYSEEQRGCRHTYRHRHEEDDSPDTNPNPKPDKEFLALPAPDKVEELKEDTTPTPFVQLESSRINTAKLRKVCNKM